MIRILAITLFLFLPSLSQAQFGYFNTEEFWNKLVLHQPGEKISIPAGDTALIVATNRIMDTSSFRFLPEFRDGKTIRYFVVYASNGKWHLHPVSGLKPAVQVFKDNNRDWVVYTEGMGKFFTTDVDRGLNLSGQYDVNVLLLDYPSITTHRKRLGNYFFAKKNAALAHQDFVLVLDTLEDLQQQQYMGNGEVSLFFHSMGNIAMRQIVKNHRLSEINDRVWATNLILNAPCVPARGHKKWVDQIRFARNIYIHYNPEDFTLGGAYLLSKRHQLGMKAKKPLSKKPVYINFSTIAGKGHSNFLNLKGRNEIPEAAFDHYNRIFHGNPLPLQDTTLYKPTAYKGIGYDILPSEGRRLVNHP